MISMLKIGEMLFCCNTDVIQNFVLFNFYDFWMQTEKKSSHCVFACTCMADYSILHKRVCYLYKKCWVMDLCRLSDITTINMSQSCVKLYECTKFGRNIVAEVCPNNVTWLCACLCRNEDNDLCML